MQTMMKWLIVCFDNRVRDQYENRLELEVFAENESLAIERAKTIVNRKEFEVIKGFELINDVKV